MAHPIIVGEMVPQRDSRKSFYGKARIYLDGDVFVLVSYSTEVMRYNRVTHEFTRLVGQPQSATTNRHMGEFAYQMCGKSMGKRDLCKLETFENESLSYHTLVSGNFHTSDNCYFGSTWLVPDYDC